MLRGDVLRNGMMRLSRYDASLLNTVRRAHHPEVTRVMKLFTRAGDPLGWLLHCVCMAVVGALAPLGGGTAEPAALLAAGALTATAFSQTLKRSCRRVRPEKSIPGFAAVLDDPDAFSFPSGHTAVAFGAATAVAGLDGWIAGAELALASAIGFSRVYLGAHYPADVLVGAALGVASGAAAAAGCAAVLGA